MDEFINWIKKNIGDKVEIVTPQFDRVESLAYRWRPETDEQFYKVISQAPLDILYGMGFRKWDSMNDLIRENMNKPEHQKVTIPCINLIEPFMEPPIDQPTESIVIDIGRKDAPTVLLEHDEDVLLFPWEWYDVIPNGFVVTGLDGESYAFQHGVSDDDKRFGCLAYGIRRLKEE
jgi:hypothetical protein